MRLGLNCWCRLGTKEWAAPRKGRDLSDILGRSHEVSQTPCPADAG